MRNLFERRSPGSEFVGGYWILPSLEILSENRFFRKHFNSLLRKRVGTHFAISLDEKQNVFSLEKSLLAMCIVLPILFICHRFIYVSTNFVVMS